MTKRAKPKAPSRRLRAPVDTRTLDPCPSILALPEGWQCRVCGSSQMLTLGNQGEVRLPWGWMAEHRRCGR